MKQKWIFLSFALILLSFFGKKTFASCEMDDFFKSNTLDLVQVSPKDKKQRLYFHQLNQECSEGICPSKAYIVSGDTALSIPSLDVDWACSLYVSQRGKATLGWLAKSSLHKKAKAKVQSSLLQGQWLYNDANRQNSLEVQNLTKQELKLEATLLWFANQEALKSGAVHDGNFSTKIPAKLEIWKYQGEGSLPSSTCEVEGHWIYPYLLVQDNGNCGALNVTARGIYRKAS